MHVALGVGGQQEGRHSDSGCSHQGALLNHPWSPETPAPAGPALRNQERSAGISPEAPGDGERGE